MVEESVLQRVLTAALRSGGEFAEVYVEDRRNAGARLDDGKIEEFTAGRERGAGIRVVSGLVHRLRPHVGPVGEGADRGGPGRRRRRPGRRGPHHRPGLRGPPGHADAPDPGAAGDGREAPQGRGPAASRRCRPGHRGAIRQVSAAYADARKRVLIANSDGLLVEDDRVRTRFMVSCTALGDGGLQTGYEGPGRTVGLRAVRRVRPRGRGPHGRRAGAARCSTPGPPRSGSCRWCSARAPAASSSTRPAATASRPTSSPVTPRCSGAGSAPRSPPRWSRWSTTARSTGAGAPWPSTTRATPPRHNTLIEGGMLNDYMWDLLRARKEGRESSGNGRRETYQSLPMVRMTNTYLLAGERRPRRHHRLHPLRPVLRRPRRRAGQHRHRRLRLRGDRGLPHRERAAHRPGPGGQPHRQRPRDAARPSTPSAPTSTPGPAPAGRTARACRSRPASPPSGWRR